MEYSDDSDSDAEENNGHFPSMSSSNTFTRRAKPNNAKLPPFTGKETWNVWFNRFEDVATGQRWTTEDKLDEMLPRLQGTAGEFVYGQLSQNIRSNYRALCKELNSRFRVIETSKAFWVQFTHRNQLSGESVEEYSAEVKKTI